jgi:hypothetical protein
MKYIGYVVLAPLLIVILPLMFLCACALRALDDLGERVDW